MSSEYQQASIEHLKYSQNGGALRARFRDGVTGKWQDGWLVGWVQGDHPWVRCDYAEGCYDFYDQLCDEGFTPDLWQYCEILTSDLGAR